MEIDDAVAAVPEGAEADILLRLRRIEGQIRGLQRMVGERRQCDDVLVQLLAVRSSLDQVALQLLNEQIERCLTPDTSLTAETKRRLQEAVKLWAKLV